MLHRYKRRNDEEDSPEINLSPMIDCIFILLIFFIVTTVFVDESGFQAHKPEASPSSAQEEQALVRITVDAQNQVRVNGTKTRAARLIPVIRRELGDPEETLVLLEVANRASWGVSVAAWDAAREAGARKISFK